ncbi:MAG TPA: MaoC family dehydratase [Ktedonobacterales bacterium]
MSTAVRTVADLKALIGQEVRLGPWYDVTQERVNAFADATGDHQFIHVDPERAAMTPFGGTIAHGFFTLSLIVSLGQGGEGIEMNLPIRMGVNYGLNRVRFPAPVRVGKRVRLHSKLQSVEEVSPGILQLIYENTVEIEGESKPGCVAESIVRLYLAE